MRRSNIEPPAQATAPATDAKPGSDEVNEDGTGSLSDASDHTAADDPALEHRIAVLEQPETARERHERLRREALSDHPWRIAQFSWEDDLI